MAKLVILKGLPCSGKTTWAEEWVKGSRNRIRVSWSDIAGSMSNRNSRLCLPLAVDAAARLMSNALKNGVDVVLDEENLLGPLVSPFLVRAQQAGVKTEWKTIRATVEECKERNARKLHPVPDFEIERKAERFESWLKSH